MIKSRELFETRAILLLLFVGTSYSSECSRGSVAFLTGVTDVIVAKQSDGTYKSTPFQVQIGKFCSWSTFFYSRSGNSVAISVNGELGPTTMIVSTTGKACFNRSDNIFTYTSEEWDRVPLKEGLNIGSFSIEKLEVSIPFHIFVYTQNAKFVVSDIDGTITRSDISGRILPKFGLNVHHDRVVQFMALVSQNKYNVIYLTARTQAEYEITSSYLFEKLSNIDGYSMPLGPILMTPTPLSDVLISYAFGSPEATKTKALNEFIGLFDEGSKVIVGAYGNRDHDTKAYTDVGILPSLIYQINSDGEIRRMNDPTVSSYAEQIQDINVLYPPLETL